MKIKLFMHKLSDIPHSLTKVLNMILNSSLVLFIYLFIFWLRKSIWFELDGQVNKPKRLRLSAWYVAHFNLLTFPNIAGLFYSKNIRNKNTHKDQLTIPRPFRSKVNIAHSWCDNQFISISAFGVGRVRVGVQVSMREFHTHIHLN